MRAICSCFVLATIAGVFLAPVIVYIIEILHEHITVFRRTRGTIQTRTTIVVVSQQVVVIGSRRATPLVGKATRTLLMLSVVKALVDDTPLDGSEVVVIHGHILLATPTKTAVVDNDILGILQAKACSFDEAAVSRFSQVGLIDITNTETQVTDNQIVRTSKVHLASTNQDALAWSRLTSNGHILQVGTQVAHFLSIGLYLDDTTHAEDDGGILLSSYSQRPT